MSPLYSYSCSNCNKQIDMYNTIDRRLDCPMCTCGFITKLDISPVKTIGTVFSNFKSHYDYQLGEYFETAEHKTKKLAELGLKQTSGEFGANNPANKMQIPCTKEQAKQIDAGIINPNLKDKKIVVNG